MSKFQPMVQAKTLEVADEKFLYYDINELEAMGMGKVSQLPYSIKVLLEAAIRNYDEFATTKEHVMQIAKWAEGYGKGQEIPFQPARIVLQDFTGVPVVVDLAAMRSFVARMGQDPTVVNPLIPVDLVIDHSVMVDYFGSDEAMDLNTELEFQRNDERYKFLKWAQKSFKNFKAVPPASGIIHQVNLEYLATGVFKKETAEGVVVYPDSLVGTDSHTTQINGLGVVGWGVGGIEAEACMLGQPLFFVTPEVVGVKLTGKLPEGVNATDLALTVTEMLRKHKVVDKFVEFYGEGVHGMSLPDRATVANMSPEYGATMGYFPVDDETMNYMLQTGRDEKLVELCRAYYKAQGMYSVPGEAEKVYTTKLELDLSKVEPSLAGPKRPQDRVPLSAMKETFKKALSAPVAERGFALDEAAASKTVDINWEDGTVETLRAGSVAIASITSCTNTSNPSVMLGAGLVAKKAVAMGLKPPKYVKTSLTPGSRVVTEYLIAGGVMEDLKKIGFHVTGYGCGTCIGNSGPLPAPVAKAVDEHDMTVAAVVSANRNFEGRVHAQVKANFLASPMLVVVYALAGRVDLDFATEPVAYNDKNEPVYFKDLWPTNAEIHDLVKKTVTSEMFKSSYEKIYSANPQWDAVEVEEKALYSWDPKSTYVQEPPYFEGMKPEVDDIKPIDNATVLGVFGDSITTDHLSPAGNIGVNSPAGQYLIANGVEKADFNSYGARRGNHEVMMRGTLANIRIRNVLANGKEGGYTTCFMNNEVMPIYDAAMIYQADGRNLIILAGKEYGTGSSRDWAAKGVYLLGVKAVIAESYERIHRSNLIGMGVLPLQFVEGESRESLGLTGEETFSIAGLSNDLKPRALVDVTAVAKDGTSKTFKVQSRIDSLVEIDYYRNGGILQKVLRDMTK
ncbi:aconitate hydratase AcnA [Acidaminobacter sp.]|uniref:aconitate hydratase AcnA n=1 Tax=Acidaminobacter sp. TaxID=1872102 RepID=UPI00256C9B4D|nr:aconitate hydratase AcnA [Acidaminobacter sp.]MDK9710076.1 aconitate hydratase AcnA [Acidaminobacter sp.]